MFSPSYLFTGISIHALREEGDPASASGRLSMTEISIHALREEGDIRTPPARLNGFGFLSTPSARRATWNRQRQKMMVLKFLSTPSARRATVRLKEIGFDVLISIHALREEGDIDRILCTLLRL